VSSRFTPRELTPAARKKLIGELAELSTMLPDPEDAPHYLAAVQNVMERWGQVPPRRNRRR